MRLRIPASLAAALLVLALLPGAAAGHHKDKHTDRPVQVSGTTDPPFIGPHRFVPDEIAVRGGGTVRFTNDEFNVAGVGAPHSWTVLDPTCDPSATEGCRFDTGVLRPGISAEVDLTALPLGTYTFICKVGQGGEPPISLVLPAHASDDGSGWTGMVGTLTVGRP